MVVPHHDGGATDGDTGGRGDGCTRDTEADGDGDGDATKDSDGDGEAEAAT